MKKIKNGNLREFISTFEKIDPRACQNFIDSTIDTMIMFNPHMKFLSRVDWLEIVINDYNVNFTPQSGITLVPKKLKPSIEKEKV